MLDKLIEQLKVYRANHPEETGSANHLIDFATHNTKALERDCWPGHFTGAAWVTNRTKDKVLLTHHRKLEKWLQLGGHADGNPDLALVARREAQEESGIDRINFFSEDILHIDIHPIPTIGEEITHFHFDIRFALWAEEEEFSVSSESYDLAWVEIDSLEDFLHSNNSYEKSIMKLSHKFQKRSHQFN